MSAALLAFLAAVLAGAGARDQMLVAGLAARRLLPLAVLVVAVATSAASAALAAKAAELLVPQLSAAARVLFAGMAAVLAGAECLVIGPPRQPVEPTRSLTAHAIVLIAHQLTDGARFLVFAIAVATAVPTAAALGGAAGGAASVLIGAMAGEALLGGRMRWPRRAFGLVLILIGLWLVLRSLN
jgi:hypothetical protein